ncbi:MAG: hypothetical protein U9R48_09410 [Chloroflexota bacterium]|nr:hypothetical protein [Chloroflexota bacterium]
MGLKRDYAERASEKSEDALQEFRQLVESQHEAIKRIQERQEAREEEPLFDLTTLGVEAARPLPEVEEIIAQAKNARAL